MRANAEVADAAPLPPRTRVGPFEIEALLHASALGFVYRAREVSDAGTPLVALKEFFPRAFAERLPDGRLRARQAADAIVLSVAREAFRAEAEALGAIEHAGLVPVRGVFVAFATLWRTMPLLPGVTLEQWRAARMQPLAPAELRALLEGLLAPLEVLHAAGLVHGHLHPAQVMVVDTPRGPQPVLLGFGAAARELQLGDTGPWRAPELARAASSRARVTPAADLYAAAACVCWAATGERPPTAAEREDGRVWHAGAALGAAFDAAFDARPRDAERAALVHAIDAAMAMAPEARPQRVADLRRLLAGEPPLRLVAESGVPRWVGDAPPLEAASSSGWPSPRDGDAMPTADAHAGAAGSKASSAASRSADAAAATQAAPLASAATVLAPRSDWTPLETVERVTTRPLPLDLAAADPAQPVRAAAGARPGRLIGSAALLLLALAAAAWWVWRPLARELAAPAMAASQPLAIESEAASPSAASGAAPAASVAAGTSAAAAPAAAAPSTAASAAPSSPAANATPGTAASDPTGAAARSADAAASAPVAAAAATAAGVAAGVSVAARAAAPPAAKPTKPTNARGKSAPSKTAAPKPATRPATTARLVAPRTTCAGRTEFAQLRCLRDQCARPALRDHPQCIELRRRGALG